MRTNVQNNNKKSNLLQIEKQNLFIISNIVIFAFTRLNTFI